MSNLIIIILAIGMAAVMGMAGIYYGGASFMAGYYKAQATQIVNYLDTYAKAVNVWSQRNGGTLPEPAQNNPVTAAAASYFSKTNLDGFLVPRFMQTNTLPGKLVSSNSFYLWNETSSLQQTPVMVAFLGAADTNICNAVEMMRTSAWPGSLRTFSNTAATMNANFCGNFGCLTNDGTLGATGTYTYIIYSRVHGRPNINNADVSPITCS